MRMKKMEPATKEEKIAILIRNIRIAEDSAKAEMERGNYFGMRSNMQFADDCRAVLAKIERNEICP